ncbi:MBL fold metallo-hydrolase [Corynebacterium cystitidis]|uniref:MBL fold metallo-hydrolase n=1 Tax=Corynebacterium cystitidis TaxID=35757 RepID=UPI00211DE4FD|nr:MBL fold metallo-hydrolase [Corynebacterium cystitidis]
MKLTILGCSGSLGAPGNPGSSYLVSAENAPGVVMDLGPGALAKLMEEENPSNVHVVFSHLHADHCSDFVSLMVWRRYHPEHPSQGRNLMFGPAHTLDLFGRMGADGPDDFDDISDSFAFAPWVDHQKEILGDLTITPFPALHPAAGSRILRVEEPATGAVLTYSGDTAFTPALIDAARNADVLLCEAAWGPSSEGRPEGMHLSGAEAGEIATQAGVKTLVLTHIQPWVSKKETAAAAAAAFKGEIIVAEPGMELHV